MRRMPSDDVGVAVLVAAELPVLRLEEREHVVLDRDGREAERGPRWTRTAARPSGVPESAAAGRRAEQARAARWRGRGSVITESLVSPSPLRSTPSIDSLIVNVRVVSLAARPSSGTGRLRLHRVA